MFTWLSGGFEFAFTLAAVGDDLRLLHVDVVEAEIARGRHVMEQITDPVEEPSIRRVGDYAPTPSFRG